MIVARFLGDSIRSAALTFNVLVLPILDHVARCYAWSFDLFSGRGKDNSHILLFRIWLVTTLVIPVSILLLLIWIGQYAGWDAFFALVASVFALYLIVFLAGTLAGIIDRIVNSSSLGPSGNVHSESVTQAIPVPHNLRELLAEKIRGQDLALEELSNAIILSARNYVHGKPLGMYLLVGATGSGKTETAKTLAAVLGWPIYREECNQYVTQYSITRLIGAAVGYKESEMGGSMTNALRASRHGVLLLDEIEKAHPSVSRVLMTLADEGRITTGMGEIVDARGWLILATSNASQDEIVRIAEDSSMASFTRIAAMKTVLKEHWPPEIIARMRSVVPYKPVHGDAMRQIFTDLLMKAAIQAGAGSGHTVHITPAAIELLSEAYASLRQYGVREMSSFIDREIGVPLLRVLDAGALDLVIDAKDDHLSAVEKPDGRRTAKPPRGLLARLGIGG